MKKLFLTLSILFIALLGVTDLKASEYEPIHDNYIEDIELPYEFSRVMHISSAIHADIIDFTFNDENNTIEFELHLKTVRSAPGWEYNLGYVENDGFLALEGMGETFSSPFAFTPYFQIVETGLISNETTENVFVTIPQGTTLSFQSETSGGSDVFVMLEYNTFTPPPTITNTIFDTLNVIVMSVIAVFTSLFTNIIGVFYQPLTGINYFMTLAILPVGLGIVFYAFRFTAGLFKRWFTT